MNNVQNATLEVQNLLSNTTFTSIDEASLAVREIAESHNLVISTSGVAGVSLGARGVELGFFYDEIEGAEIRFDWTSPIVSEGIVSSGRRLVIDVSNAQGNVEASIFQRTSINVGPLSADLLATNSSNGITSGALFGSVGLTLGGARALNAEFAFALYDFEEYLGNRFVIEVESAIGDYYFDSLVDLDVDEVVASAQDAFTQAFVNGGYFTIEDATIPAIVESAYDGVGQNGRIIIHKDLFHLTRMGL